MFLLERIAAFFLSILILLGVFGTDITTKKQTEIKEMNLKNSDVTNEFTVSCARLSVSSRCGQRVLFISINLYCVYNAKKTATFRLTNGNMWHTMEVL